MLRWSVSGTSLNFKSQQPNFPPKWNTILRWCTADPPTADADSPCKQDGQTWASPLSLFWYYYSPSSATAKFRRVVCGGTTDLPRFWHRHHRCCILDLLRRQEKRQNVEDHLIVIKKENSHWCTNQNLNQSQWCIGFAQRLVNRNSTQCHHNWGATKVVNSIAS